MARDELADRRRREIVAAAYEVFAERGYHDAGIADIAAKLGIGHGTFYRYFENKRDVLDHALGLAAERVASAVSRADEPTAAETLEQYRSQVRRIAEELFALLDRERGIVRIVLFESTSIDPALTERVLRLVDAVAALTARYLENGKRRGFLRADLDVDASARAINGMILAGALEARHSDAGARDREAFIQAAIGVMFEGIRHPQLDLNSE